MALKLVYICSFKSIMDPNPRTRDTYGERDRGMMREERTHTCRGGYGVFLGGGIL